jgi:DNA-directed RNA polymerase specialized sigma24 family protein
VRRHHRLLLRYARRARLGVADADDADVLTMEVIEDAVLRLVEPSAVVPRDVSAYLAKAFRNRYLNRVREARTRERHTQAAAAAGEAGFEGGVVTALVSEAGMRDAHSDGGMDRAPACVRRGVLRLGAVLDAALSDDERQLLTWVSEHVPQRVIAEWLGVSFVAARQRLSRLRRRLHALADRHVATLDAAERAEVEAVLHRNGGAPWGGAPRTPRRARGRARGAHQRQEGREDE